MLREEQQRGSHRDEYSDEEVRHFQYGMPREPIRCSEPLGGGEERKHDHEHDNEFSVELRDCYALASHGWDILFIYESHCQHDAQKP